MNSIIAGIVLYNPNVTRLKSVIESIINQVEEVCIYDNGSVNIDEVKELINNSAWKNINLIIGGENKGIAYALNRIAEYSLANKYTWLLTLDHDTISPSKMIEEYKKYITIDNIAMLCPNVIDKNIVNNAWGGNIENDVEYVERCIQSGALLNLDAWSVCEGFDEWMFVDFVDFDFCKKVSINKYKMLRCNNIVIDHEFGKRSQTKFWKLFSKLHELTGIKFFKYFTYNNVFSSARIFYCTRNNIAYIKRYALYINKKKELMDFLKRILSRIIRGENKMMIISSTIRGVQEGMKADVEVYTAKN